VYDFSWATPAVKSAAVGLPPTIPVPVTTKTGCSVAGFHASADHALVTNPAGNITPVSITTVRKHERILFNNKLLIFNLITPLK
jgi:hypothetical protein